MRYLGVDFGAREVGLAISDEGGRLAFPLKVVKNDSRLPALLADLAAEEGIETIIMGESLDYGGKPNHIMAAATKLKETLEQEFKLEVVWEPEWLTSREAARDIEKDKDSHARAAAIILRSYLERKNYHA